MTSGAAPAQSFQTRLLESYTHSTAGGGGPVEIVKVLGVTYFSKNLCFSYPGQFVSLEEKSNPSYDSTVN